MRRPLDNVYFDVSLELASEARKVVRTGRTVLITMLESQQVHELIISKARLANDGPQCSSVQLLVERYDSLRKRIVATQDDVASFLALEMEADSLQGSYALAARYCRQFSHFLCSQQNKPFLD
jgi:hypothetical protein